MKFRHERGLVTLTALVALPLDPQTYNRLHVHFLTILKTMSEARNDAVTVALSTTSSILFQGTHQSVAIIAHCTS